MGIIPTPKRVLGTVRDAIATGLDTAQSIVGRSEEARAEPSQVEVPAVKAPTIGTDPKRRHTSKASRLLAR